MPVRLKRLIGTIVILVFVLIYALSAALVGSKIAISEPMWIQIIYFPIAGLLWILPVGALIYWMYAKPAVSK